MKCEYCDNKWGYMETHLISETRTDPRFTDGRTMKVSVGETNEFVEQRIKFCPMCSRKLTEEK